MARVTHPTALTDRIVQALRAAGLRPTPQRLAVYGYLVSADTHPTAQQVYAGLAPQHPSLSLATVYNTLETLVKLGVVNALGPAGDDAVHYDADTSPHINLACVVCHRVVGFPSHHALALQREVVEQSGYEVVGARVLYYGRCPACQAAAAARRAA